jgi:hypothetical protein
MQSGSSYKRCGEHACLLLQCVTEANFGNEQPDHIASQPEKKQLQLQKFQIV